jgi:3,4-dihydroxy 2-butanone 4-phosphate synthase/GTP cyclohydrolase II
MFPLRSRTGGVMVRAGQTEAAVDLARIAGLYPAGVICEIMNEDGTMARVPELAKFARRHGLLVVTIADLIKYRIRTELLVKRIASAKLPTAYGEFLIHAFQNLLDNQTHVALVRGDIGDGQNVLVRVHSQCLTGDVLHSIRCDCGAQLEGAMERKAGASGWRTRSAPTSCRTRASTRSKRTSGSASRPTNATTAWAFRSCASSGSAPCG